MVNKILAVVYALVLLMALVAKTLECFFEAVLESGLHLGCFLEKFSLCWNDERYFTPVSTHWGRVKEIWYGG